MNNKQTFFACIIFYGCFITFGTSLIHSSHAIAAQTKNYKITRTTQRIKVEHKLFKLYFVLRTAEQMAAFYYARGFPETMVRQTKKVCFITVGMNNKSKNIIWLDIREWKFSDKSGSLTRYDRPYWFALWKKMNIPLRFQSTFRWTLIPTSLDYQPGEREGGNITLQRRNQSFTITAIVRPGKNKNSKAVEIVINNVKCLNSNAKKRTTK